MPVLAAGPGGRGAEERMAALDITFRILHFTGLLMGFSVTFANIVMAILISRSSPEEVPALRKFPPMMSRVGSTGLAVLWVTGIILLFRTWDYTTMPWEFWTKIGATICLTFTVAYIHRLEGLIRSGDAGAIERIQGAAKAATLFATLALVFAVITFN